MKNAKTEPVTVAPQRSVRKSFGDARKELAKVLQDEDAMYAIPWFLMVGEPGCNKNALLPESGLAARPGSPNAYGLEAPFENHWWFFNDAVVIDMAENLFSGANDMKGGATKRSLISRLLRRSAPSRGAWRSQLEELQNVRRRRPMDGIILTVDVNRLRDLSAEDTGQLGRRGEAVAAQIRDAQYLLGVDFPVYVLLTNCESLQGFSNFTRALPEPMRDQIFGWSSPYETEIPYQSGMIDEAIAAMRESVCMSQIEMIPQVPTQKDRDALYLLPRELRMLTEPLRLYLDPLFKTASFKRGLPLRGIYLTANVTDQPPAPPEAAPEPDGMPPLPPGLAPEPEESGPVGRPRFVRQVFSEKIFQEPGLTHIDEKRNKEAAKTVFRARLGLVATFIICGIFMWLQSSLTQARVEDFGTMKTLLSDYQKTRAGAKRDPGAREDLEALKILANLSESQFETIFAPLSLGTGLSSEVSDAIGLAMSGLVGRPLLNLLRDKADSILSPALELESPRLDETDLPVGLARHDPKAQVASLYGFAGSVNELEGNFHKYERHGLMEVQSVYEYATGESLEGLAENSGLYGDALRTAKWPKMSFKGYESRARVKLQLWMADFHRDLFHGHPLKERLLKLRNLMDTIQALKGGESSHGRLRAIRDTIRGAKELLADGRSDWLLAKNFTGGAGPDYAALLSELNKSGFNWGKTEGQSRDFRDWREAFSDRNEREFQSLKGALLDFKLLQVTEKGVLQIVLLDEL